VGCPLRSSADRDALAGLSARVTKEDALGFGGLLVHVVEAYSGASYDLQSGSGVYDLLRNLRLAPDEYGVVSADYPDQSILVQVQFHVDFGEFPGLLESGLVVIGDNFGAITLGAIAELGFTSVRVHQDARSGELALANNADLTSVKEFTHHDLTPDLVSDARIVALRLPRSLDQLDQWSALIAAHAADDVLVFAGGRIKHMTLGMNDVMKQYFTSVVASLAVQKSRVLRARGPITETGVEGLAAWPKSKRYDMIDMTICAHGGVFSGINLDIGTRELLNVLEQTPASASSIVDFGCGTGVLAVAIARLRPKATVVASDQSAAACRSVSSAFTPAPMSRHLS